MLYDPKWERRTKTKDTPWLMPRFVAWLETKPPEEEYDFLCADVCAIAQYLKFLGAEKFQLDAHEIPQPFRGIVHPPNADPWTFGAALERARKLAAS